MVSQLRRFFLRHLRKMRHLPPKLYAKIHYEYFSGNKLDLDNPQDFNAKIAWYKVFFRPKILNQLADKYAVRSYVEEKIGNQYLNDCYGVYEDPYDIPFTELPDSFVIKPTHTSSYNIIVPNKESLDIENSKQLLKRWLRKNQYYKRGQEWAYKDVPPRLIVEKYLKEEGKTSLIDYKYFCFDGKVKFLNVHIDRSENHQQGWFDLNFKPLPFAKGSKYNKLSKDIKKPENFNEMIRLSELLAEKFPFVRVDFYSVNGKTIFGEMTFYPGDGRNPFYPEKYNKIIGDYFKLPKLPAPNVPITNM